MTDKIFGADFVDETNPAGTETVSINNGTNLKDIAINYLISLVTHNATSKTTPVDADEIPLVDSAASNGLKKLTWANLKATLNAIYDWATVAHAATSKTTPVDADEMSIVDSAASNVIKKLTWANLKATLKTYFDTLYTGGGGDVIRTKYIITPSIASNNLTIALKYIDGTDPSSSKKLTFRVGDTEYDLTAATSFTKNAGTNWCNLGGAELATLPNDLFLYAIGETGASAGLKFGFSRIPFALTMGDFVNTNTNEKYIAGNWTNFNATDAVAVIGRFRATLSATAAFNWSIATALVINRPIYETDWTNWNPTLTGWSAAPTNTVYRFKISLDIVMIEITQGTNGTSNAAGTTKTLTLPFTAKTITNATWWGTCQITDNGTTPATPGLGTIASAVTTVSFFKDWTGTAAWTNTGNCRVTGYNNKYAI